MIGQKGVPATYGGVERHVEEISARLAARGHAVRVYTRPSYGGGQGIHRGMELVRLPSLPTKHFDAISHSVLSALHCRRWAELVHVHGIGPALVLPIAARWGRPAVLTVHALDYQREKWGAVAKWALRRGERLGMGAAAAVTAVSEPLRRELEDRYHREVIWIPNGVAPLEAPPADTVRQRFALEPGRYFLFAARLVPEKGADLLLDAYRELPGDLPLVIAGGSSHSDDYVAKLQRRAAADPRVRLLGYVHGDALHALYAHALAFVLPSKLEGLSLSLLEAMRLGALVIASDVAANLEVIGAAAQESCAMRFRSGDALDLRRTLEQAAALPALERQRLTHRAQERTRERYDWDRIVERLEGVYEQALARAGSRGPLA